MKNYCFMLCCFFLTLTSTIAQTGETQAHDPSTIQQSAGKYWLFSTGNGIKITHSNDLNTWKIAPQSVFKKDSFPTWINEYVPKFQGHFWAPDCIFMNGKYYLYYSCSSFGSTQSAIGVATNVTLDIDSPQYHWEDLGMVISSKDKKDFNAIDPSLLKDNTGKVYMTYGSFFGGIAVVEIDSVHGKVKEGQSTHKIAGGKESDWEAACMIQEGEYYYLFVNNGLCCKGLNSTYYIVGGRSKQAFGPFLDETGKDLNAGGGNILLRTEGKFQGPGHVGLLREKNKHIVSIHYYDGDDGGKSKINILNMYFKKGWVYLKR